MRIYTKHTLEQWHRSLFMHVVVQQIEVTHPIKVRQKSPAGLV